MKKVLSKNYIYNIIAVVVLICNVIWLMPAGLANADDRLITVTAESYQVDTDTATLSSKEHDLIVNTLKEIGVEKNDSCLDKVKSVFDWMTENIAYDTFYFSNALNELWKYLGEIDVNREIKQKEVDVSTPYNTLFHSKKVCNIEWVFEKRLTICSGYAAIFKAFMDELNVPCVIARTTDDLDPGSRHSWNMVLMDDGHWYHVDVTWGRIDDEYISYWTFLRNDDNIPHSASYAGHLHPNNPIADGTFYEETINHNLTVGLAEKHPLYSQLEELSFDQLCKLYRETYPGADESIYVQYEKEWLITKIVVDKIKESHIIDDKEGYGECSSEELYNIFIDREYQYHCIGWDGLICPRFKNRDEIILFAKCCSRSEMITDLCVWDIKEKYIAEWEGKYCDYSKKELADEFNNRYTRWESINGWTYAEDSPRESIVRELKRYDKYGPYPWYIDSLYYESHDGSFKDIDEIIEVNGIKYKVINIADGNDAGGVELISVSDSIIILMIPDTIVHNGHEYKVTDIASKALEKNKRLKSVSIGKNISKIGEKAFYKCKNLTTIVIKSEVLTAKEVKKNAFRTIGVKAKITVPKGKLKDYAEILKKAGIRKNTTIIEKR